MDKVKLGFLGVGGRGSNVNKLVAEHFRDIDIVAVCDVYEDRAKDAAEAVKSFRGVAPKYYTNADELLADKEVNTVIISAAWEAHAPLAVKAMKAGKVTGLEVGGAYSIDDCWSIVRTYEETKTPFMFLENCCFGKAELLATSLVRKGKLGEVVFCHASYCHDLREEICGGVKNRHYRLRNYLNRNCDNYPTHNLGPIAKILNVNRGNRLLKLTSVASKSRGLSSFVQGKDEYAFLQDKTFAQGDVVCTNITCADGTLISLKLDTTLPRAYSREFLVNGTKGIYKEDTNLVLTDEMTFDHEKNIKEYADTAKQFEEYLPPVWREDMSEALKASHGGIDAIMLSEFFDAAVKGKEMPIDVYDAATWMAVTCQSEASISAGGMPVEIPDFTNGKWIMREPKEVINLD